MAAQARPRLLIQRADLRSRLGALENAETLGEPIAKPAGAAEQRLVALHAEQRSEQFRNLAVDEALQPGADGLGRVGTGRIVDGFANPGPERIVSRDERADRAAAPCQLPARRDREFGIGSLAEPLRLERKARRDDPGAGLPQGARLGAACVGHEAESLDAAETLALHHDFPGIAHLRQWCLLLAEPPHERRRPPIDKSLNERRVQRV